MNAPALEPQVLASDPKATVFVTANAGSGKTSTLVKRVARLLLREAKPEAILCVTYTKAAAAEMQRRLFEDLGDWAVKPDKELAKTLAELDERPEKLSEARQLFARALETPGGLKIQTIHAFCEKLLRRFPLEAGVSPGFQVLEDAAAAEVSAQARDDVADYALQDAEGPLGRAYAHFSVELDWRSFNAMFATFEAKRGAIAAYVDGCDVTADVWKRCGFGHPTAPEEIEAAAVADVDWNGWRFAADALMQGSAATDQPLGLAMKKLGSGAPFAEVWAVFCTQAGTPRARLGTKAVDPDAVIWLTETQGRLGHAAKRAGAARIARDTLQAITLARAYAALYETAKARQGGLDFGDLIARTHQLLTVRADAAWVLYKLDGGIDHVLLDEAQDTAPDQWDILRALTGEFYAGSGSIFAADKRTVFAVGDEKQSIYSFQGAAPERFLSETRGFQAVVEGAGRPFRRLPLLESWRSTPEVLAFVDAVFADPEARAGLRPLGADDEPIVHVGKRDAGRGGVDLWSLEESEPEPEFDPWLPVDFQGTESANKKLARRIAVAIKGTVERREAVFDKQTRVWRPAAYGDFLILVRRRRVLFHEIIRALKREGVAVGGADRLKLSDHVVFQDLVAIGRFARFPTDDLTLAALLRSPFCDVDEEGLYDLARDRPGTLWAELSRRAGERPAWGEAADLLGWALAEARVRQPFDFYGRLLSRLDRAGRSMRARILTRLGHEAEDALDAFLGETLAAEQRGVHDLEDLLSQLALSEIEVKREQEDRSGRAGGEVRVMTAHGSKGLEAPIVILPDTTTRAGAMGGPLLDTGDGGFLWAPRKADDCEESEKARTARELAGAHESLRLLYVALTRARDRLIICGVKTKDQYYKGSWHDFVARAFSAPEAEGQVHEALVGEMQISRFGFDPQGADLVEATVTTTQALPTWARSLVRADAPSLRYASPSTLAEAERGPSASPLDQQEGLGRYRRGLLIHRLLQLLPDLPLAEQGPATARLLEREPDLTAEQRTEMAAAALGVLADDRFAAVFGPHSRAEAAVAGGAAELPPGLMVSGRVDRLVVEADRVLVVDFKTNRPAPDRIEDADEAYLVQMAVYVAVLREVFPGRRIEAALVWTDGPKLMPVPENIVTSTLAALRAAG